jgi:hypothetical protein
MAKCGITNINGGGGIGSDELSVTKKQVLKGKTYVGADTNDEIGIGELDLGVITATSPDMLTGKVGVDKNGNPVTGTMANRGSAYHGVGSGLNTQGLYYYIGPGYYSEGSNNPWVYMTRAEVAASLGIEPWKMRGDVNVCGVQGGIPLQNTDTGNAGEAWATDWGNWGDGNVFMGVRSGHLLNGVNWIRRYIPNFVAGNIKKGVPVGGIVGTFEGWVPGATDLYSYGNNVANFTKASATNAIKFDTGQITLLGANPGGGGSVTAFTPDISLVGRSYANILFSIVSANYNESLLFGVVKAGQAGGIAAPSSYLSVATRNFGDGSNITLSVPIDALQGTFRVAFSFYDGTARFTAAIHRIWLS